MIAEIFDHFSLLSFKKTLNIRMLGRDYFAKNSTINIDNDNDSIQFVVQSLGGNGKITAQINSDNSLTFDADDNYFGTQ